MKTKINKEQLRNLILNGISSEELNSKYDYSHISDMSYMFGGCSSLESVPQLDTSNVIDMSYMFDGCLSLKNINPFNFDKYDFSELRLPSLMTKYPEAYI